MFTPWEVPQKLEVLFVAGLLGQEATDAKSNKINVILRRLESGWN